MYTVNECYIPIIQEKVQKLNKKAIKLGCEPIIFTIIGSHFKKIEDEDSYNYGQMVKLVDFEITGKAPIISGWSFLASIDHSLSENIFRKISDVIIPEKYYKTEPICEHCGYSRRRKDTYLVRNITTNEIKQVGRSCLKDFTGHTNPEAIAKFYETMLDFFDNVCNEDYYKERSERQEYYYPLESVIARTVVVVNAHGYISKQKADERNASPTSGIISASFNNKAPKIKISEEDLETTKKILEFISNITPKDDYERNLNIIAKSENITYRNIGYACSMVPYYNKAMDLIKPKNTYVSQYVGEVGSRVILEDVVVENIYPFDGSFGVTYIHKMKDKAGNVLTWFSSGKELVLNTPIKIKVTIKDHTEYKGIKQTVISRVKTI